MAVAAYGSDGKPVSMDPFGTIVEVGWSGIWVVPISIAGVGGGFSQSSPQTCSPGVPGFVPNTPIDSAQYMIGSAQYALNPSSGPAQITKVKLTRQTDTFWEVVIPQVNGELGGLSGDSVNVGPPPAWAALTATTFPGPPTGIGTSFSASGQYLQLRFSGIRANPMCWASGAASVLYGVPQGVEEWDVVSLSVQGATFVTDEFSAIGARSFSFKEVLIHPVTNSPYLAFNINPEGT